MQLLATPALPLLLFLLAPLLANTATYPWWGWYPPCTWPYLDAAVPSECGSQLGLQATQCLCGSSDFLAGAAKTIGPGCGCSTLNQSAQIMVNICTMYGLPIALDRTEIVAAGTPCKSDSAASSTPTEGSRVSITTATTTATVTTTQGAPSTTSPVAGSDSGKGAGRGLSNAGVVAIAVVSSVTTTIAFIMVYCGFRRVWKRSMPRFHLNHRSRPRPLIEGPGSNLERSWEDDGRIQQLVPRA